MSHPLAKTVQGVPMDFNESDAKEAYQQYPTAASPTPNELDTLQRAERYAKNCADSDEEGAPLPQQQQQLPSPPGEPEQLVGFSSGLWSCWNDPGNCCLTFFCLPYVVSTQYNVVYHDNPTPHFPLCAALCGLEFCSAELGWASSAFTTFFVRQQLRQRYGIFHPHPNCCLSDAKDSIFVEDVVLSMCCMPCIVCQHHREMVAHGDLGVDPVEILPDSRNMV